MASTEGAQPRERSGAMLNLSLVIINGHESNQMPRSPIPRTLLAILPVLGALLAAYAAHQHWPIPLSLLAMAVIASAAAVIYWSAPLIERKPGESREKSLPTALAPHVMPAIAATSEQATVMPAATAGQSQDTAPISPSIAASSPAPGSIGTRADALVTGDVHETDLLTGLLSPEAFFARLASELSRCAAANHTAILVICDLDAFGQINRTIGLMDANRLLRQVADCFRLTVREGDMLSRLGGDEFGIFFPGLPREIAEARVRDLRAAVREAGLLALPESSAQVTACIGVSCFPADGATVDALLTAADLSLAKAKRERQEKANIPIPSALVLTRN
jgi:diguanylate cyclase (GGDEF)-like protein